MANIRHAPRVSMPHRLVAAAANVVRPARGPLDGLRLLVVHDSPEVTSALADVFAAAGARVAATHEASEANMLLAWGGHDMVFLDAAIPGATDVLDLLAVHRPNLFSRTIVLTADLHDGEAKARLRASYPAPSYHGSWLVDLVAVATRTVSAAPAQRAVA